VVAVLALAHADAGTGDAPAATVARVDLASCLGLLRATHAVHAQRAVHHGLVLLVVLVVGRGTRVVATSLDDRIGEAFAPRHGGKILHGVLIQQRVVRRDDDRVIAGDLRVGRRMGDRREGLADASRSLDVSGTPVAQEAEEVQLTRARLDACVLHDLHGHLVDALGHFPNSLSCILS
jgi:hypothetical protein